MLQLAAEELAHVQSERRELFLTAFERVAAEISGSCRALCSRALPLHNSHFLVVLVDAIVWQ